MGPEQVSKTLRGRTAQPEAPDEPAPDVSDSIEQIINHWQGLLRSAARRWGLLGSDEAELAQDLRIRLWRALATHREKPRAIGSSYVYQAVMSAAIDLLRRRRSEQARHTISLEDAPNVIMIATQPVEEADLTDALDRALGTLAPDRRVVVRMHLDGKHRDEIADILGWSQARTRNLLYRGLEDLKRGLQAARDRGGWG